MYHDIHKTWCLKLNLYMFFHTLRFKYLIKLFFSHRVISTYILVLLPFNLAATFDYSITYTLFTSKHLHNAYGPLITSPHQWAVNCTHYAIFLKHIFATTIFIHSTIWRSLKPLHASCTNAVVYDDATGCHPSKIPIPGYSKKKNIN